MPLVDCNSQQEVHDYAQKLEDIVIEVAKILSNNQNDRNTVHDAYRAIDESINLHEYVGT